MKKIRKQNETTLKPLTQSPISKEPISVSYMQYTPESKRRLSLKLFSKIVLTSPTLRTGVKKCTKRLFDQMTPQKSNNDNEKHKLCDESNVSSPAQESKSNVSVNIKAT